MRRTLRLLSIPFLALSLLFLVACSDSDDDSTQQGSESQVCGDLDSLDTAVDQVKGLNTSSSISEVGTALTAVVTAGRNVVTSLGDAKDNRDGELSDSINNLQSSLTKAVSSGSLSSAQAELQSAANDVQQDVSDAKSKASCSN